MRLGSMRGGFVGGVGLCRVGVVLVRLHWRCAKLMRFAELRAGAILICCGLALQ